MEIINIDKLANQKVIVMVGRNEHVEDVASCLVKDKTSDIIHCPGVNDYFFRVYDKPKELNVFGLVRPPQSWCYVEELC